MIDKHESEHHARNTYGAILRELFAVAMMSGWKGDHHAIAGPRASARWAEDFNGVARSLESIIEADAGAEALEFVLVLSSRNARAMRSEPESARRRGDEWDAPAGTPEQRRRAAVEVWGRLIRCFDQIHTACVETRKCGALFAQNFTRARNAAQDMVAADYGTDGLEAVKAREATP